MSPELFAEWEAFYAIEPWGYEVNDARLGIVCSAIFGAAGGKLEPSVFMMRPPKPVVLSLSDRIKSAFGFPTAAKR